MKNNEYNIVNVTNEKNNLGEEYSSTQKVEYSFHNENKDPNKDELNDRTTINDKVEDNILKKSKSKKKEHKESTNNASESSSASSSSTASVSSASASSASSAGHVIVASATVAVAAVGSIVGINIINQQEEVELATFLSSEITTNSIDFSFSMPSKLLSYEEDEEQSTTRYEKVVVFSIENEDFFNEEYLEGYEEIDENYVVFYAYMNGLTPDTSYALTINLRYFNPELGEKPIDQKLASRVFKTEPISQSVRFDYVEASQTQVSFAFIVDNAAVNYDPESQITPAIQVTISDGADYYDEGWIESYEQYDENSLICYYDFSGLTASTKYTISIYVSLEQEFKFLGSTSFTTEARPSSGFTWGVFTPGEDSVSFTFYVNAEYVGFEEGREYPNMFATLNAVGKEQISYTIMDFSLDGNVCTGEGTIYGLTASTEYNMVVYYVHDNETESLGSRDFTTTAATPTFYFAEDEFFYIGDNYISPMFYIKKSEVIVYRADSSRTNIYMTISGGMGYTSTVNIQVSEFEEAQEDNYYFARHAFEGLDSNIEYTISVYNDDTTENYGNIAVRTTESVATGLTFIDVTPSTSSVVATFSLSTSYVGNNTQDVSIKVANSSGTIVGQASVTLRDTVGDAYEFYGDITGLSDDTPYILGVYFNNGDDVLLGVYNFTTEEAINPTFNGASFNDLASFYAHECTLTLDFVDDPENPQFDNLSIQFYSSEVESESRAGDTLGSLISIQSTTDPQTITIPYSESGGQITYDFDLDDIKSFDILATQVEVFSDDITFINDDQPGAVNAINTPGSAAINYSNELVAFPIQLEFTDDAHEFENGFTLEVINQNNANSWTTTLNRTENYQYAVFNDYSFMDNVMSGTDDFTLNLYALGGSDILCTDTITEFKVVDINQFYHIDFSDIEIDNLDTTTSFSMVYLFGDSSVNTPQLVFVDEDSGAEYVYSLSLTSTYTSGEILTIDLMNDVNSTFASFSDLADAMGDKTFKVVISCQQSSGGSVQEFEIGGGISFYFSESI